jgi:hypothetical protein
VDSGSFVAGVASVGLDVDAAVVVDIVLVWTEQRNFKIKLKQRATRHLFHDRLYATILLNTSLRMQESWMYIDKM